MSKQEKKQKETEQKKIVPELVNVTEVSGDSGKHLELEIKQGKFTFRVQCPFYEVVKK